MTLINDQDQQPLANQGDGTEKEEQTGDTASANQNKAKREHDPADDNPNHIENPDYLHEIQVDDDLNEPDADEYQPEKNKNIDNFDNTLSGELDEDTP